ncbi:hypothetical protein [Nonomuraea typhae]|uniref:Uncharacterized protein n=1 Tax=Nonomuraea typhae TaxID=2603600 RepID=A0ABW7Z1K8_9ACTN
MSDYVPISAEVSAEEIAKWTQPCRRQTDGMGLRVGNKAEFTLVAPLKPGGGAIFRERVKKAQVEAAYWEGRLGTVHDLRVALINDDTQILFAASYSDEFKPYVVDVIKFATPWIDYMFTDVAEGYPGLQAPGALDYIARHQVEASVWYASNEQATVRDIARGQKALTSLNDLLDTIQ